MTPSSSTSLSSSPSSFSSDDVIADLNYINPEVAPENPETPLPRGLGVKGGEPYAISVPQKIRNGRHKNFRLEKDGFELLSNNVSLPLIDNPRERYYAAKSVFGPMAMKLVQERYSNLEPFSFHFLPPLVRKSKQTQQQQKKNTGATTDMKKKPATSNNNSDHNQSTAPHGMAHNDYGFGYDKYLIYSPNPMFFQDPLKRQAFANKLAQSDRFLLLQFWIPYQPPGTVIENDTMAFLSPQSLSMSDLVTRPLSSYGGQVMDPGLTILQAKPSPKHEWWYFPNLESGKEGLVFCGYDSSWKHNLKPCFHSSIHLNEDDNGRRRCRPRESLECRVIVFCKTATSSSSSSSTLPPRSRL